VKEEKSEMKHRFINSLAGSTLLLLGLSSYAQERDRDRDRDRDDRYRNEETYHRDARNEGWWKGRLFERVRQDLEHAQAVTIPFTGDQRRLARTKEELNDLQSKMAAGRYDQPELDDTIAALENVISSNRLSERDRDMLTDDLTRLRQFREHHDNYR
jgi:hypothetical protein